MVMDWRFKIQWRGPFSQRIYPDTDSNLNISGCSGGQYGSVSDVSWVTQLTSGSEHSLFGVREKLSKAEISFHCCVVNVIPRQFTNNIQSFCSSSICVVCSIDETGKRALEIASH